MSKVGVCIDCGERKQIRCKGVCKSCYDKQQYKKSKTKNIGVCDVCGKTKGDIREGKCISCRMRSNEKDGYCIMCGKFATPLRSREMCDVCLKKLTSSVAICKECGELKRIHAKGLCGNCYFVDVYPNRPKVICKRCGEEKIHHGKGMCKNCHSSVARKVDGCIVCNEEKMIVAKGMCQNCYARHRRAIRKELKKE